MSDAKRRRVQVEFKEPSLTKQSFREQVNINSIIERNRRTGMLDHVNTKEPFYGDVSGIASYQDALNIVNKARELFDGMSATIRERFLNDPARLVSFLEKPENLDEAIRLGIAVKRPEPAVSEPVVDVKASDAVIKG